MGIENLGQIASAVALVLWERDKEAAGYTADLKAFNAPSECGNIVWDGWEENTLQQVRNVVEEFGVSFTQFKEELQERCDGKWLHQNGFDEIYFTNAE